MTHSLAPPTDRCDVCHASMQWCVGGMRCPHEYRADHDEARGVVDYGDDEADEPCGDA